MVTNNFNAYCKFIKSIFSSLPTAIEFEKRIREAEKLVKIKLNNKAA